MGPTTPKLVIVADPEVVERWRTSGAEILRTDVDGAIRVSLDDSGVRWETFRGRAGRLVARPLADTGAPSAPSGR